MRGDVAPPRFRVAVVMPVSVGGLRGATAPLVLAPEAPELGAPVFPPLQGRGGAVGHQPALLGGPVAAPLLRADQQEGPAHVEGGAAAAQVSVGDPEGPRASAEAGRGPRAEDGLHRDGELPPGAGAFHSLHLDLQH